jgi:hypothetical protein
VAPNSVTTFPIFSSQCAGTLNDGKSAFCAFRFDQFFFESFKCPEEEVIADPSNPPPIMAAALPLAALNKLLRGGKIERRRDFFSRTEHADDSY